MAKAKNIVGVDHKSYVYDQIKTRQEVLLDPQKDNNALAWVNSKTSWIRMASGINISDEKILQQIDGETKEVSNNGKEFRLKLLGLEDYAGGNALAKDLTLFAGTSKSFTPKDGGLNSVLRYGIITKDTAYPAMDSAYGLGGTEFGLKPLPGIIGFNTSNLNKGALRVSNISVKANNRKQFEYIEALYLRIGYTVFVEWGHTSYYTTNGSSRTFNSGPTAEKTLMPEFLNASPKDRDQSEGLISNFYRRIEDYRKQTEGNYDAILGKVRNFNWSFNEDGSYTINVEIVSYGDIIESLSVNGLYASTKIEPTKDATSPKSSLEAFFDIATGIQSTNPNGDTTIYVNNAGYEGTSYFKTNRAASVKTYLSAKKSTESDLETAGKIGYTRPKPAQGKVISGIAIFGGDGSNTDGGSGKYGGRQIKYVRLGDILDFINDKCLLYDQEGKNIVKVDTDESKEYIVGFSNGFSVSADPTKVMVRQSKNIEFGDKTVGLIVFRNKSPKAQLEQFHFPIDSNSTDYYCRILNLYFATGYLTDILNRGENNNEGKVSLYDFLTEILETANKCLGGVNKFKIRLKDEQTLEIYDENRIPKYNELVDKDSKYNAFNLYGLQNNQGNFVRDISLKSELTKEFSTLVSVGAQSRGIIVGENATFFSKWNVGLVDRIVPKKLDKDDYAEKALKKRQEVQAILDNYYEFVLAYNPQLLLGSTLSKSTVNPLGKRYNEIVAFPNFDLGANIGETNINKYIKAQRDFFQLVTSINTSENTDQVDTQVGFLPINLSLTIDGLSGIRIFDELKVNTKFLPKNYTETLDFIIKTVSHEITDNQWVTKLETFATPKTTNLKAPPVSIPKDAIKEIKKEFELPDKDPKAGDSYIKTTNQVLQDIVGDGKFYLKDLKNLLPAFNKSPDVQEGYLKFFKQLLEDPRTSTGYAFVLTTGYRPVGENARVYGFKGVNTKSSHIFGMAQDVVVYKQNKSGGTGEVVASKATDPYKAVWQKLGIEDACKVSGITWGWQYQGPGGDCVHFAFDGNFSGKTLKFGVEDGSLVKVSQWRDTAGKIIEQLDKDLNSLADRIKSTEKVVYKYPSAKNAEIFKKGYQATLNRLNLKDYVEITVTDTEIIYRTRAANLSLSKAGYLISDASKNPWPNGFKNKTNVNNYLGIPGLD